MIVVFELCAYGPIIRLEMNREVAAYPEDLSRKLFIDIFLGLEYGRHYLSLISSTLSRHCS
jgi:hypothetical protein